MKASGAGTAIGASETTARGGSPNYGREWKVYRFRRNLALFLLAGVIPFSAVVCLAEDYLLNQLLIGLALSLAWFVAMCVAIWWAGEFRCPRCYRRFGALGSRKGVSMVWRGLFDDACANCKLRRWE